MNNEGQMVWITCTKAMCIHCIVNAMWTKVLCTNKYKTCYTFCVQSI